MSAFPQLTLCSCCQVAGAPPGLVAGADRPYRSCLLDTAWCWQWGSLQARDAEAGGAELCSGRERPLQSSLGSGGPCRLGLSPPVILLGLLGITWINTVEGPLAVTEINSISYVTVVICSADCVLHSPGKAGEAVSLLGSHAVRALPSGPSDSSRSGLNSPPRLACAPRSAQAVRVQ